MKRKYPYQAWVLLPSFKPKELTITKPYGSWSASASEWDVADGGKSYHLDELFASKAAAIAAGRDRVTAMQADIEKRQIKLRKRIAELDKADQEKA